MARRVIGAVAGALVALTGVSRAAVLSVSPIQKVLQLLSDLEFKVQNDGQAEQKLFDQYVEWCKTGAKDKEYEIKTAKSNIEDLQATIGKADSDIATFSAKVEDLGAAISTNSNDLKAATEIREKEHKEFTAVEKELVDSIDTLERAINVLERKMRGSAMLQASVNRKNLGELVHTMKAVVEAASLSLSDKQRLIGLVQSNEDSDDDAGLDSLGAPAAEVYQTHGGSIVDVLEDLKQKAVVQLDEARREEMNSRHNFQLMKQSLEDQIKVDEKDLASSKTMKHDATETRARATGDLTVSKKGLADAESVLKNMKGDCLTKAQDHEISVKNRQEELKALAEAKKAIAEMTGGAAEQAYGAPASLLQVDSNQVSTLRTRADLANFEVVNLVRKLAREQKSAALAQLAGQISAAMREGASGSVADPFAKVKNLISGMIERLMREAGEEAQHKAYCDKEMKETKQKTEELKYDIEKLSSKIDKSRADSAMLKDEVSTLQAELAEIARSQAEADGLRNEEHSVYVSAKADLEQGLTGVRMALKVLREYYANNPASFAQQPEAPELHSKSTGAGTSIIGMLEVIEADLGKSLASTEMHEDSSATAYQKLSMENKLSKTTKEQDVKYKTKEAANLDKAASEAESDHESLQTELDAVLQVTANIRGMCELKPETYEERKGRREAEVAGLREALQILDGEAVLLQRQSHLRGRSS
eukprot:TRINITY_DN31133_c0_g1_i1.p1 TRINITY_DN31133_c0_g1~~TRINITY_DN31133_c0_g1_i1.p1  ORF type:complete len:724 (+),score=240.09 TRINITY_DN31133_c0_g1_i1:57-2174(+)